MISSSNAQGLVKIKLACSKVMLIINYFNCSLQNTFENINHQLNHSAGYIKGNQYFLFLKGNKYLFFINVVSAIVLLKLNKVVQTKCRKTIFIIPINIKHFIEISSVLIKI